MGKRSCFFILCIFLAISAIALSACGGSRGGNGGTDKSPTVSVGSILDNFKTGKKATIEEDQEAPDRDNTPVVLETTADGFEAFEGTGAAVDFSHAADGYIMAKYEGDNPKIKIQITRNGGSTYTYNVHPGEPFVGYPLSEGEGAYNVAMFLNIEGDKYSQACAQEIQADITDEFSPFLRPNQYSNFTESTRAVTKSSEIAQGCKSDLKVIEELFLFVTGNVVYDYDKAKNVQSGYIPDIDETLTSGKGICFDYASLMVCMMRTQRIPCRLVVGYAGEAYHAWISVHVDGIGWVANMIQFNDDQWTLMDPTFAAGGDTADPNVIGDGENYNPVYYY